MHSKKRIVIVAGEASGDLHASNLVRELLAWDKNLEITGIGGRHMEEAGVKLLSDLARFGVTGLIEVFRHLRVIKQAFRAIQMHLRETKPDLLILVDYPGFNLRLAKFAKQELGIKILYYISPQIWAWKANRIKTIQANIDRMAVILPFEKEIYQNAGVAVTFVGHPLLDKIQDCSNIELARAALNLPKDKRLVALLPGSRIHEIEKHMPVLIETIEILNQQHQGLHFAIPIANSLQPEFVKSYFKDKQLNVSFIVGQAKEVVACCDCAVVASGTASLECALQEKPMCIIYKGSWFSYYLAMKLIRVKYLGLCNLLTRQMIVPELLQYDCNSKELSQTLNELLTNEETTHRMLERLQRLKFSLSSEQADCSLSDLVKQALLENAVARS
ncbi:lipid-A-disaccharide synthase [Legionella jordanis]|uniref:Lipid-A-disaccharide synthase n=1 Tax=Legionella jordanis TaxID=456 RepID=A0A0W0V7I3_9GAMM|nr:lipid-A-disaccharide synthase [Legionella jordanis]KTD16098.1 lipid-A-disaccharide synthase [Legionella jordanis]RMX04671.1 lipid-A-disaccharide synthase [Legionella jordanis]RMX18381.1 lipid-A-disaccharide synthase [Legionella jordanis]VEH12442.1 lipid-A-disaccharide synthase [Legionella jordanis]HAT8713953.1 lipid-A-disaccharide synthase [Legionella jordanis]